MRHENGIRLWPLGLILLLSGVAIAIPWLFSIGRHRQDRVLLTLIIAILTAILSFLWFLLFSRMRWRTRITGLLLVTILGVATFYSVRFSEVSGDLIPSLRWRWSQPRDARLAVPQPVAADLSQRPIHSEHDFPGYMGPQGDGTILTVQLDPDWATHPPRELWRREIGSGWSGFAVAGDFAVTQEQRGAEERTTCHDLKTGEILWSHAERARHDEPLGGPGPRATPAIGGERVFSLGATGILCALDLRSGELLWRRDVTELAGVAPPEYGYSASPRLHDGKLLVVAGGTDGRSVLALDPATGESIWSAGSAPAEYATPTLGRLAGREQWIVFSDGSVNAFDTADGTLLWTQAWPQPTQETAQARIVSGDRVLVSSGYGVGARMYHIAPAGARLEAELLWESRFLKAKFSDFVIHDDHVYGLDDGILTAVALADGSRAWKRGRYGHGQLLLVNDLLLIQAEDGSIALVEARPDEFIEHGRVEMLDRKTWNHPTLVGRFLLLRNDEEVVMLELAVK